MLATTIARVKAPRTRPSVVVIFGQRIPEDAFVQSCSMTATGPGRTLLGRIVDPIIQMATSASADTVLVMVPERGRITLVRAVDLLRGNNSVFVVDNSPVVNSPVVPTGASEAVSGAERVSYLVTLRPRLYAG
ncbi:MAG TPA: hypothetical protein VNS80_04315 [Pseudolysinimonas sp.]|nr:hypothetical protein [Pseudolysinimonas sp.]